MNEPTCTRRRIAAGWVLAFAGALALYALTASRGIQWQDSGDRALRIYLHELDNPMGLALVHPLHHWLGRLALLLPGIEPVVAITLVSALAGAVAVANVFGAVMTAVRSAPAAAFAAASLALAHTVWQLSTITETYTLSAALFAAECWCLLAFARNGGRGLFWAMLFFNGLGMANHLQAGLTTPVLAVVALLAWRAHRLRSADVLIGAVIWLTGTLPYSTLVLAAWIQSGDFAGTLRSALFGHGYAANVLNTHLSLKLLAVSVVFPLYNFPNLLWPAAVYGLAKGRSLGVPAIARRALLAGLLLHAVFVLRYNIVDQYMFFLPAYVVLSIFGGIGAAAAGRWASVSWRRALTGIAVLSLGATPVTYWLTAATLRQHQLFTGLMHHHKPYRDDYTYVLVPWSVTETSAQRISAEAVHLAGAQGIILIEDAMAAFAVEYQALRSGEAGVEIHVLPPDAEACAALLGHAVENAVAGRRVVLVPLDRNAPKYVPSTGRWARKGDLYVLDVEPVPASMGAAAE